MIRSLSAAFLVTLFAGLPASAKDSKYSIKEAHTPPPMEIAQPIRKLLGDATIQLLGPKGNVLCEVWFRKELPVKATDEQVKNGLTYREVEESSVFGAIRIDEQAGDYRKQKVKPGFYTIRLGFQPMDGDHMGTAPFPDFCLLVPAKLDEKPDTMDAKELRELSAKAIGGSHPGVFLLYPNEKPEEKAKLVDKGNETWVLNYKQPVSVEGKKAASGLGVGLTLIGHTMAE